MGEVFDEVVEAIRASGGRVTPARREVLQAILEGDDHHFTAADVQTAVQDAPSRPDRATVYRTLELLTELGVIRPIHLDGDATVYHRADLQHGHLVCEHCGAVVEVPTATLASIARTVRQQTGFVVAGDRVALTGTCADCAAR